jgi:IS605 OrfB family transposase
MRTDKHLPDGYVRTAWKSEIYPLSIGRKGKVAKLADVVRAVHLMFKARRIAWNTCIAACRKSDEKDRQKYLTTGEKTGQLCYNTSELYRIAVRDNPRFPNTFTAWALDFLYSRPRPQTSKLHAPVPGAFVFVNGVRGWWSIANTIKRGEPNRKCCTDISINSIPNAYNKWFDLRRSMKTNPTLKKRAVKWARAKKGRQSWQYGRPRFHRRANCNSTYLHNQAFKVEDNRLFIGGVPGSFKIAHPFPWPPDKKPTIAGGSLTEKAGRFFASFSLMVPREWVQIEKSSPDQHQVIGLDLGISKAAVSADVLSGETTHHSLPRYWESKRMRLLQKRLRKWSHALQRRKDRAEIENRSPWQSNGYKEAVLELQKINLEIANLRRDAQHKLTRSLVEKADCLVVEDLDVAAMTKGSEKHTSGAKEIRKRILDTGFGEIRRQLTYKSARSSTRLLIANQWYPSTQTCSSCGRRRQDEEKLSLSDRTFKCPECGHVQDRDENAAFNLGNLGKRHFSNLIPGDTLETNPSGNQLIMKKASDTPIDDSPEH